MPEEGLSSTVILVSNIRRARLPEAKTPAELKQSVEVGMQRVQTVIILPVIG